MNQFIINGHLLLYSAAINSVMLINNVMERGKKDECYRLFQELVVLNFIYNLLNAAANYHLYRGGRIMDSFLQLTGMLLTVAYYGILILFAKFLVSYISNKQKVSRGWIVTIHIAASACIVMWVFFMIVFSGGLESSISRRTFYYLANSAVFLYLGTVILLLFCYRKYLSVGEWLILNTFAVLPSVAAVLRIIKSQMVLIQICTTLSVLLINGFLHTRQAIRLQEQEKELMKKKVQLTVSQIRPHFVFNVLNTIYILCENDPQEAQEAIDHFSKFLRTNLDSLGENENMIPLNREMIHVYHYLELEKIRYGDEMEVVINLAAGDFCVPSLTVQPIVENAVKYGIHSRPDGGRIDITTSETKEYYVITVSDNGKGFDPEAEINDGKEHVGISNVRERLAAMCGGKLEIESRIGEGTVVRMLLPKGEEQDACREMYS